MRHQHRLHAIQLLLVGLHYLEAAQNPGRGIGNGAVVLAVGDDDGLNIVAAFQAGQQGLHHAVGGLARRLHQIVNVIDDQETMVAADMVKRLVEAVDPVERRTGQKEAHIEQIERPAQHGTAEPLFRAGADELVSQGGLSGAWLASDPHAVDAGRSQYGMQFGQSAVQADIPGQHGPHRRRTAGGRCRAGIDAALLAVFTRNPGQALGVRVKLHLQQKGHVRIDRVVRHRRQQAHASPSCSEPRGAAGVMAAVPVRFMAAVPPAPQRHRTAGSLRRPARQRRRPARHRCLDAPGRHRPCRIRPWRCERRRPTA